jgi:hypothetical protein
VIFPGLERIILQGRIWLQDSYLKIKEIAATEFTSEPGTQPTTPPVDHFYLYGKENGSGIAAPHWKDEEGNEHEFASMSDLYTDERAQDAVGGILTDTASIDFTYNDAAPSITATVLPAGVDHGGLAGLADDDHTQYVLRSILTTNGDLFTRLAGAVARLGVGTEDQVLTVSSGLPAWADPSEAGGHILLSDTRATPFAFNDMLQMDLGEDFMWTDSGD